MRKALWAFGILALLPAAAVLAQGGLTAGGNATGSSIRTYHELESAPGGAIWNIGSETSPVDIILDPNAGPWIKTLLGVGGGNVNADDTGYLWPNSYWLTEHLHVGGTLAWTDWHEHITTPGWYLGVYQVMANGQPIQGLELEYIEQDWPNMGGGVDIYFAAQQPCTNITIKKMLVWTGDPNVIGNLFSGTIQLVQYPTPEPASLALLALGGLAVLRRRR